MVDDLYVAVWKMDNIVRVIKDFVEENKELDQKSFALKVKDFTPHTAIAFSLRKGVLLEKAYRTLLEYYLGENVDNHGNWMSRLTEEKENQL